MISEWDCTKVRVPENKKSVVSIRHRGNYLRWKNLIEKFLITGTIEWRSKRLSFGNLRNDLGYRREKTQVEALRCYKRKRELHVDAKATGNKNGWLLSSPWELLR